MEENQKEESKNIQRPFQRSTAKQVIGGYILILRTLIQILKFYLHNYK